MKQNVKQQSLFTRREFLNTAATLMATSPFILWCERARSMAPFAFWKKRSTNGGGSSTYPTDTGDDPYWDYVVLCMNMDLPTPSTGFTTVFADESNVGKPPTISGTPSIGTSANSSPYSGRTGRASFSSGNYVSFPDSNDFDLSNGDFTIEFFLYASSLANQADIIGQWSPGVGNESFVVMLEATGTQSIAWTTDGNTDVGFNTGYAISTGQWYHVAVVRSSSTVTCYVNGVSKGSLSIGTSTIYNSSRSLAIGARSHDGSNPLNGYLSDLRIYKGIAKYTANFTPRTTPLGLGTANDKYWGYCVLACPFENSLKDTSGKMVSTVSSPVLSTAEKKFGTASAYFTGGAKILGPLDDTVFDLPEDFTIEAWLYCTGVGGSQGWVYNNGTDGQSDNCKIVLSNSGGISATWKNSSGTAYTVSGTYTNNQWFHVAFCKAGTQISLFCNGQLQATTTTTGTCYLPSGRRLCIGQMGGGYFYYGYIDSLRITKGVARYTSNFTPPTASFPVGKDETIDPFWSNVVCLVNFDGSDSATTFSDFTARHTLSTSAGSPALSSTQSKFGGTSLSLNGSSAVALSAGSDFNFGTDSFTVEYWIYSTESSYSFRRHIDQQTGGGWFLRTNTGGWNGAVDGSLYVGDKGNSFANITMPKNAWNHVAFSKLGSSYKMFMNGVQVLSGTDATSWGSSSNPVHIGGGTERTIGYIDDVRITKGVARYQQNFTPPTRTFATTPVNTSTDYDPFFSYVSLLLNMDGTISDLSNSPVTVTTQGSAQVSTSIARLGTGSLALGNTTSDWISVPHTPFDFGTGDFTLELYLYATTLDGDIRMIFGGLGPASPLMQLYYDPATGFVFSIDGDFPGLNAGATLSLNRWYHLALVKHQTDVLLFLDGVLLSTESVDPSVEFAISSSNSMRLGHGNIQNGDNHQWVGHLDGIRVTKGVARYTTSFAPPSKALPTSAGIVISGLVAVLDAGDAASYDGSSQTWKNICLSPADSSTQTGYDFYRGSSSSSESSDPTFVGVSGGRSANDYFSFDGGDFFTLNGSNTSFINAAHCKGAKLTIEVWFYLKPGAGATQFLVSTQSNGNDGFWLALDSNDKLYYYAYKANVLQVGARGDSALPGNQLYMVAVSLDESVGAGAGFLYANGSYVKTSSSDTFNATYANTGTTTATYTLKIGSAVGGYYLLDGSRIYQVRIYNRALTKTELDQNFNAVRGRFGI